MGETKVVNKGGTHILLPGMFLVFLTLKLTGVIGWTWWWVTAPLWGPFAIIFPCVLLYAAFK